MRVMLHPTPQDEDAFLFHIDNEISFFLEQADLNKDGVLSQEELLAIKVSAGELQREPDCTWSCVLSLPCLGFAGWAIQDAVSRRTLE